LAFGVAAPARLPQATRVGGVHLQVADLGRSVAYYREGLGLRVIETGSGSAVLGVPGSAEPLVTLHAVPGTRSSRPGAFGLFHFAILLPDRAALGRFVAHLSSNRIEAAMSDHHVSESIYLTDPDGLGIEVYADRPRNQWPISDGQLFMTTEPLNVRDLLRAGGAAVWEGAPEGTKMGHVHLHVGDLKNAAAFYHQSLGFDITVSTYPGALFLSAGGYHHHLGTNVWAPGPSAEVDRAQLLEWTLFVPSADDAQAAAQRLLSEGFPAIAADRDWLVTDPWGTRLRIVAKP
jgi:catechol 2,3-dioxygenase